MHSRASVAGQGAMPAHAGSPVKRVLLAQPHGYCAGLDRAVEAVERALERHGRPVDIRNEIVHNQHVVAMLRERGVVLAKDTDYVPPGAVMMFSAHGVSPAVRAAAKERGLQVIDATCPLVTKVNNEVNRFARRDYEILLVGHDGHEEVEGTCGEALNHVQVIGATDSVDDVVVRDESKVMWCSERLALAAGSARARRPTLAQGRNTSARSCTASGSFGINRLRFGVPEGFLGNRGLRAKT